MPKDLTDDEIEAIASRFIESTGDIRELTEPDRWRNFVAKTLNFQDRAGATDARLDAAEMGRQRIFQTLEDDEGIRGITSRTSTGRITMSFFQESSLGTRIVKFDRVLGTIQSLARRTLGRLRR